MGTFGRLPGPGIEIVIWQTIAVVLCTAWATTYLSRRLIVTLRATRVSNAPVSSCHGCEGGCSSNSPQLKRIDLVELRPKL